MTNGRGAGMASFMTKKKKYKFQVEICLEELLEVPLLTAVLFAKLRLLDGGSFQDNSSREEVRDHKVKWGAKFTFPCKMMANASTGVMERCILRISIRKESKGGRSFNKLGFVDINLAEYAGAGVIHRKALLEGYDTRHRQDNSMLQFSITMNMLQGDILFKVPSPSLKHKQIVSEDTVIEPRTDEFSSGSLAGSIASGSSGFGSLPKKRPALLTSDLVIGQTLAENNVPVTIATDCVELVNQVPAEEETTVEQGHSRNSSNTSQLSKASGYSSIHSYSHSRQSSSGDSGHMRDLQHRSVRIHVTTNSSKFSRTNTCPKRINIPNTIPASTNDELFSTPQGVMIDHPSYTPSKECVNGNELNTTHYFTPKALNSQISNTSSSSAEYYATPETSFSTKTDIFSQNFNELQKSSSASVVERVTSNKLKEHEIEYRKSHNLDVREKNVEIRLSLDDNKKNDVLRSKSEFEIPKIHLQSLNDKSFKFLNSDSLFSFLTPRPKRKQLNNQSTPSHPIPTTNIKFPASPIPKHKPMSSLPETRTSSLNSLRSGISGADVQQLNVQSVPRGLPHRKLLEGTSGGKLAPLATSPDETPSTTTVSSSEISQNLTIRRPSVTTNPSSSSLPLSETGSLDRSKTAYERRKKIQATEESGPVSGRVEVTRVNPGHLIEELLKNTNLEPTDDSAETSGLQLFIAKDGTAALGNHEVKSQMSTGVQVFKQVVMDDR